VKAITTGRPTLWAERVMFRGHEGARVVAVAPRADATADHHLGLIVLGGPVLELAAHLFQERDGLAVGLGQLLRAVAQQGRPVGRGAPGGALQNEADAVGLGDGGMGAEVALEGFPARAVLQ
jgi:hypothetical protein